MDAIAFENVINLKRVKYKIDVVFFIVVVNNCCAN